MMNKIIPSIFFLVVTFSSIYAQETFEKVDQLITEKKYDSAFKLLEEKDPNNINPEVVLKKIDIALNYFVKSISHQMFSFKDLEKDEDLISLRRDGSNQSFSMYMFQINEVLDTLLVQHPKNFKLNKALGNYYYDVHLKYGKNWLIDEKEMLKKMYKNCKIATENNVGDYLTHYCVGYYHLMEGQYEEAIPYFLSSIEKDPKYPTSYYNLSICYIYTKQAEKGVDYAIKSIDLYDDITYKADAARVAATIYKQIKDYDNALKYYHLSDNIQPESYYTINQLLELQLEINQLKEAEKSADSFFKLGPKNPQICSDLVEIYVITKKEEELIKLFNKKIEENKSDKEVLGNIYFHLGQYYHGKEDKKLAKENFLKAKEYLEAVFEKDHYVFQVINKALKEY